jgi:hypothetical protein
MPDDYTPTTEAVRTVNHDANPFAPTEPFWLDANGTIVKMPCTCGKILDCDAGDTDDPWPDMLRHRLEVLTAHDAEVAAQERAAVVARTGILVEELRSLAQVWHAGSGYPEDREGLSVAAQDLTDLLAAYDKEVPDDRA